MAIVGVQQIVKKVMDHIIMFFLAKKQVIFINIVFFFSAHFLLQNAVGVCSFVINFFFAHVFFWLVRARRARHLGHGSYYNVFSCKETSNIYKHKLNWVFFFRAHFRSAKLCWCLFFRHYFFFFAHVFFLSVHVALDM